jgi:NMD protein affecting ribosome stability and mRNA decay
MQCDKCKKWTSDPGESVIPHDWTVFCPKCSKEAKETFEQVLKVLEAVQQL